MIQKIIPIPLSVRSNYKGYSDLLEIFDCYVENEAGYQEIVVDFCDNICFDTNMLPIIGAYVEYGAQNYRIVSRDYNESTSKIHQLFLRNNFIKSGCGGSYKPLPNETAISFQVFHPDEVKKFAMYLEAQLMRYFKEMQKAAKRRLIAYMQGLFENAREHGECEKIYTCGQYFPSMRKMDISIVNTGTTIKESVSFSMRRSMRRLPAHCIEWAIKPEHALSTGLAKVYEFVYHNNGKFQIISGNEFLELNEQILRMEILDYSFPGTIINFEMDEKDTDYGQDNL